METLFALLFWWAIVLIASLLTALWVHQDPERARAIALAARRTARVAAAWLAVRADEVRDAVRSRAPRTP